MGIYRATIAILVSSIGGIGYPGIFFLMLLESSFFPFPSEAAMIPAGYLAYKGEMSLALVVLSGVLGSVAGAWLNYAIAYKFGRKIVLKAISKNKLEKVERFFRKHGSISTFNGRLIPVVRQYISFPAGLAGMSPAKFTVYTALGAGVWDIILVVLGYFLGENQALLSKYLNGITLTLAVASMASIAAYLYYEKRMAR